MQITVDETDIIAVVGDALVDDMSLSVASFNAIGGVIEERRWYRGFKRWEFKLPTVWIDRERTSSRYLTCMLS